jgi:uncharacterized protein (TIGR02246 family)
MAVAPFELIAAEFGVRQLQARCVDAVWRKDAAAFANLFMPDGVWKVAGLTVQGRTAIARMLDRLTAANERILMRFGTPIVELVGMGASARTYTIEHVKRLDGAGLNSIGIYYETFAQADGAWHYAWRHFDFCYFGPADLSAELYPFVDYGAAPALPGRDAPTAGLQAG